MALQLVVVSSLRRAIPLLGLSLGLTLVLGFGLPAALRLLARLCGLEEGSAAAGIVLLYGCLVLCVARPPLPRGSLPVSGKEVLITGCDTGFGLALAKHLHAIGFTVFAGCLLKDKNGDGAAELERLNSDRMKVLQLNVCSEEEVAKAFEFVTKNLKEPDGGIWGVVNNAGITTFGEVEFMTVDKYKEVADVNLWGTVRVTKAFLPLIRRAKERRTSCKTNGTEGGIARALSVCNSQKGMLTLFAVFLIFSSAEGDWGPKRILPGKCPNPPVQDNFDINKYLGRWYEIERNPTMAESGRCIQTTYSLKVNGKIDILNEEIVNNGTVRNDTGEATQPNKDGSQAAKLKIHHHWLPSAALYWILSTDYNNYALVYSCISFKWPSYLDYIWILSRNRKLSPEIVQHLKQNLTLNNIKTDNMEVSDQTMCPEDY